MRRCNTVVVGMLMLLMAGAASAQPPDKPAAPKPVVIQANQVRVAVRENGNLSLVADGIAMEITLPNGAALTRSFRLASRGITHHGDRNTVTAEGDVTITVFDRDQLLLQITADSAIIKHNQTTAPADNKK